MSEVKHTGVHPDRTAFRAIDACGGSYSLEEIHSGWADGHAFALAAALEAVKPVDDLAAELLRCLQDAVSDLETTLKWREGWECSDDELLGTYRAAIQKAVSE